MTSTFFLICCPVLAAAGLAVLAVFLHRRRRAEERQMTAALKNLQAKIEVALTENDDFASRREHFRTTLQAASLTTDLQRTRLSNMSRLEKKPPEKYKIITQLAARGMDIEEIAALLSISPAEAGQLLNLCTVARMGR